jgi:hypothetical protein
MASFEARVVSIEEGDEGLYLTRSLLSKENNQDYALENTSSSHLETQIPFNNGASFSQAFVNLINVVSG